MNNKKIISMMRSIWSIWRI